jgi:hypothetical protein
MTDAGQHGARRCNMPGRALSGIRNQPGYSAHKKYRLNPFEFLLLRILAAHTSSANL